MRINLLKLSMIFICFYLGKSDFIGKITISRHGGKSLICLGTADTTEENLRVLRCSTFTRETNELDTIEFQDGEIFSHLLILHGRSWEKSNPDVGNEIAMTQFEIGDLYDYVVLPLLYPNQEKLLSVHSFKGMEMGVGIDCINNYYGPRCKHFCNQTNSEGRYICHPQTGRLICMSGYAGNDCTEKVDGNERAAQEPAKSRSKRRDCMTPPCPADEIEVPLNGVIEMDFRGAESFSYCNGSCDQSGTRSCVVDEEEGTLCKCRPGHSGRTCSDMDICYLEKCQNGAECQKAEDGESFCVCPTGYSGRFCEAKIDNCLDDPCGEYGECVSDASGFRCICDVGFEGEKCESNIDDCLDDPCSGQGECYDDINSYVCECFDGFYGENCENNGCTKNPCQNGGNCSLDGIDVKCECQGGYVGTRCEQKYKNPCQPNPCGGHGTCYIQEEDITAEGVYEKVARCSCNPGYIGEYCETAVAFCNLTNDCPSNSTCVSMNGEYMCLCPEGYEGDYCEKECGDCEMLNELQCEEDPCQNGGRCIAVGEDVRCICQDGYQGSRCASETDFCIDEPCGEYGICQSTRNGFKCLCHEGFTGDTCVEDVDECEISINLCKNGAECVNSFGGFSCNCPKGYTGTLCEEYIDACSKNPCLHGGSCIPDDQYTYTCNCKHGYMGHRCEHKIPCENNPCQNGGQCELDHHGTVEGYYCLCEEGFHGTHCENKLHPCTVKTTGVDGTYKYAPRTDCGSNGICQPDGEYGFKCECLPGYQGKFCDRKVRVTECSEPYCVCGSTIRNRKFLNQRDQKDSACFHPRYGSGKCSVGECVSTSCNNPPQLVCEYTSQCRQTDVSSRMFHGRHEACGRLWITFSRTELPEDTTIQGICETLRQTRALRNVLTVTTKCFSQSIDDVTSVVTVSFEAALKLNARRVREEFRKYLKNVISTSNFADIEDETTVRILEAIDNVTDGNVVTRSGKFNKLTKPKAPVQPATSTTTLVIAIVCAAVFVVTALIIGAIIWMKKRKPVMTSSPVISRAENNNPPVNSVKFSKSANGKRDSLLHSNHTEVFHVNVEDTSATPSHDSNEMNDATNGH